MGFGAEGPPQGGVAACFRAHSDKSSPPPQSLFFLPGGWEAELWELLPRCSESFPSTCTWDPGGPVTWERSPKSKVVSTHQVHSACTHHVGAQIRLVENTRGEVRMVKL